MRIYCTFHPSSVLEGGFHLENYIREDFVRLARKQLRSPSNKLPRAGTRIIGWDTEYSPTGKLLTIGLADTSRAAAIETNTDGWLKRITPIVKRARIIVGHSVEGDLDYLVRLKLAKESWLRGIDVQDSFLLARMVDENRGKGGYALEPLLLSEFNFAPWKHATAELLKKTGDASDWSVAQRTGRCRIDAWATRRLAENYFQRVTEQTKAVWKERLR